MDLKRIFIAVSTACAAVPAVAADDYIKGVYLRSAELCAQAKKDGLQSIVEGNNLILTNDGFETIEFNCAFLQFVQHPRMPGGWVITSMCEEPDHAYPEMFSTVERRAGELDIAALSEVKGVADEAETDQPDEDTSASSGLSGTYFFCEGVNPP